MNDKLNMGNEFPSPLWGGLGWGSLRPVFAWFYSVLLNRPTPTPALPTRGRGKFSQSACNA